VTRSRQRQARRLAVAALLVGGAVSAAAIDDQLLAAPPAAAPVYTPTPTAEPPRRRHRAAPDSHVPAGTTVFADDVPGVARLDPELLGALRRAAFDAGLEFVVNSGWRSEAHQQRLLQEAVSKYGSAAEAARWVATPETSPHVSGDAVDIAPAQATTWLSEHGAAYGLCRIYGNEPWHYELRPEAVEHGCPPMYPDPTHDPRMHP
jgi:LAS superfamily LD-carboxypeptidase LdcB